MNEPLPPDVVEALKRTCELPTLAERSNARLGIVEAYEESKRKAAQRRQRAAERVWRNANAPGRSSQGADGATRSEEGNSSDD